MRHGHKRRVHPRHVREAAHQAPLAAQWYTYDPGSPTGGRMSTKARLLFMVLLVLIGIIVLMHRDIVFPAVREAGKGVASAVNKAIGADSSNNSWSFGNILAIVLGCAAVVGIVVAIKEGVISIEHLTGNNEIAERRRKLRMALGELSDVYAGKTGDNENFKRLFFGLDIVERILNKGYFKNINDPKLQDLLKQIDDMTYDDKTVKQWAQLVWDKQSDEKISSLLDKMKEAIKMTNAPNKKKILDILTTAKSDPGKASRESKSLD